MVYTTNQLVAGAYYASGVVSREFQTLSGTQFSDGMEWLNDILADKRVDQSMNAYETEYAFNAEIGVQTYYIPNLVQIDTIAFYLDTVRYSLTYAKRNQFFGSSRVENVQTLPFQWYFERKTGGGNLHIYFAPDRNYPIVIHGSFNMNSVTPSQDLSLDETTFNLGVPTFFGSGNLEPGQLVVNNFDLEGIYPNIGTLVNYINSGIIPGISARIDVNSFVLSSTTKPPSPIYIRTNGYGFNGTNVIGPVAAATIIPLNATYNNGSDGIGATLTNAGAQVALTIDSYAVAVNDRILVKDQAFEFQNGSYEVTDIGSGATNWVLTRTTNYDQSYEVSSGDIFTVTNGTLNGGQSFIQSAQVSEIGTSDIIFDSFDGLTFQNFSTIEHPLYEIINPSGLDQFYITYLRYALAARICAEYNFDIPPNVANQLQEYKDWISKKSRLIDLKMQKVSTLQKNGQLGWAWINLGKGWVSSP